MTEKCKPYEIYRRLGDVHREACLSRKNIHKWATHGFATMSKSKRQFMKKKHSLVKKKFWVQQSVKKVMPTGFRKVKGPIVDFFEKRKQ